MAKKTKSSLAEQIIEGVEKAAKTLVEAAEETAEELAESVKEVVEEKQEKKKAVKNSLEKKETNRENKETADTVSPSAPTSSVSTSPASSAEAVDEKRAKLRKLREKAKALEKTVEEAAPIDLKKKMKPEEEEKKDTLVPMEDYLKASIHLGTRVITPNMRTYVYRRRADGLAVFNTALLDDKLREGAAYLAKFAPHEIMVVCKREAGWRAVSKFSEVTGIRAFTKKYPAGVLTNTNLENFMETNLVFICDPWLDKNALEDANRIGVPILSLCDTNNFIRGITQIIPGNNKSAKSIGMIFYLLTKLYVEARALQVAMPPISDFIENWDTLQPSK